MPHTGVFSSLGNESNLDDGTDWLLLKAGVPNPDAAKAAATSYLVDVMNFQQGQTITVQGGTSSLGTVPTILMTSASGANVDATHPLVGSNALLGTGQKTRKKAGSSKKNSNSQKTGKAKPSKKNAAKKIAAKSGTETKGRKSVSKAARKKAKPV